MYKRQIQSPVSLYEPVYTDGGDTLYVMDQISDKKNREERWVEELSLGEAMKRLPERERHIIDLRFFEGKTPVSYTHLDVYKRQGPHSVRLLATVAVWLTSVPPSAVSR